MKKKHFTFLIRTIIAVLALFGFSFFYWYGKVDLFYFPFSAQVWGVASDWVMVVVTFFTAILLYKTLVSQQRTLREQIKITRIESENRKLKIVPRFAIDGIHKYRPHTDQYIINLKLSNGSAHNCKIYVEIFDPRSEHTYFKKESLIPHLYPEHTFIPAFFEDAPYFSNSDKLHIDLQLSFNDADGNPYIHKFGIAYQNPTCKIFHEDGPIPDTFGTNNR